MKHNQTSRNIIKNIQNNPIRESIPQKVTGQRSKRLMEAPEEQLKWGFDLTGFPVGKWEDLVDMMGLKLERTLPEVHPLGYQSNIPNNDRYFDWIADGILVRTCNNPITGEHYTEHRKDDIRKGFASYIGIEGDADKVNTVVEWIKDTTNDIKEESPDRRDFVSKKFDKNGELIESMELKENEDFTPYPAGYSRHDDLEDLKMLGFDISQLLDSLILAMSDQEAWENFSYIRQMNDFPVYGESELEESKILSEDEKYVVTAFVKKLGKRDRLSKPLTKSEAEKFARNHDADMKLAISKYQWSKETKVEKESDID
jgi:uncharacterized protein (DUF3820 family)